MTTKKFFYGMIGATALVAMLAIAGIILGVGLLQKKSANLMELKIQNQLIEEQQTALIQAKKDVEKYAELEKIAKSIVPQDKDQAKTVREIISLADQSNIKIDSIIFPDSTLGKKQAIAAAPTAESSAEAATPKITLPPSQLEAVKDIPGLFQMEIKMDVSKVQPTYNQLIDFLSLLEQNRRTAQIAEMQIKPDQENRNRLGFTLIFNVFVKP